MAINLDDYNDVAARIAEFRDKHSEGSLQPLNIEKPFEVVDVDGQKFVVYAAAAYRSPDDLCPGVGVAWEPFPGRTPYTKDSELQNAETAAWGRAIVAALAADTKKGIASAEEVANRQPTSTPAKPVSKDVEETVWPFGAEKGKRLSEVNEKSLRWFLDNRKPDPSDKWFDRNKAFYTLVQGELESRSMVV